MTVKRTTSPYIQNLVVLATREGDGEERRRGGRAGEGKIESINLSIIHHMGRGVGVLDIHLPIFSPEQALKPVPLLRKANSK